MKSKFIKKSNSIFTVINVNKNMILFFLIFINILINNVYAEEIKTYYISRNSVFGCEDKDKVSELFGYLNKNDKSAYSSALTSYVSSGVCAIFINGEEVYLENTSIFSGLVKIRARGVVDEFWVPVESIKEKKINKEVNTANVSSEKKSGTIGVWYDDVGDPSGMDSTLTILLKNGKYYINRKNGDGSKGVYQLQKSANKYSLTDDKFGLYYEIKGSELTINDNSGYIRSARKIKY